MVMQSILPGEHDVYDELMRLRGGPIFGRPTGGLLGGFNSALDSFGGPMTLGAHLLANQYGGNIGTALLGARQQATQDKESEQMRQYRQAQIEAMQRGQREQSPFGVVSPADFTPASLEKFKRTGNYEDLVRDPSGGLGRYNPGQYTPESWDKFLETNDPGVLKRYVTPAMPSVHTVAGAKEIVTPSRAGGPPSRVPLSTIDQESAAAETMSGAEARGAAFGKVSGEIAGGILKKGTDAKGVQRLLEDADALIDVATGSSTGAARDRVAAAFGYAPEGAQAIAELQVLQANLMLQQPRMEGPQSNYDQQLYREMAGQIGDPKVPAPTKKAALRTIRKLQEKYVERAGLEPNPQNQPKRIRVDAQGNVIGG